MKNWIIKRFGTIGSRFGHLQNWVAYTVNEGEHMQMLGCNTEGDADALVKRFRDTGKMKNPVGALSPDFPEDIEPLMVAKMQTRVIYRKMPLEGNE